MKRTYIAIDLKSFYASVECVERGLDPLTTNLVVADASRMEKTICLAVSPSLKKYGIPGRPRLFEVVQKIRAANAERKAKAPERRFTGSSFDSVELEKSPNLEVAYITAAPRMAYYMEYSTKIFDIYLRYIAPEDMHVYSIDEVFMDVTSYLKNYKMSARELALKMIRDVLNETGVTATAGIGSNLYLSKIAMDIVAKKIPEDEVSKEESYEQLNLFTDYAVLEEEREKEKDTHKYDDIIDMPHHQSKERPHMSFHDRTAQFATFVGKKKSINYLF